MARRDAFILALLLAGCFAIAALAWTFGERFYVMGRLGYDGIHPAWVVGVLSIGTAFLANQSMWGFHFFSLPALCATVTTLFLCVDGEVSILNALLALHLVAAALFVWSLRSHFL